MLTTSGLQFSYENGKEFEFPDISLAKNEHLLIIGKSGIGKTTLLHLLSGIYSSNKGSIRIGDTDFMSMTEKERDRFRGNNIGLVFQKPRFIQSLNLRENLKIVQNISGNMPEPERIDQLLGYLKLSDLAGSRPTELSQGEQQRATIAMALLNNPSLILADEPTSSLDDENTLSVIEILKREANRNNSNLVIITHDNRVKSEFENVLEL